MVHRKLAFSAFLYVSIVLPSQSKLEDRHHDEKLCFFNKSPNSVIPLLSENFFPRAQSIFFHETDCNSDLNTRQACAVESAAKQNPHWSIYVLLSGDVTNQTISTGHLYSLKKLPNVRLFRILLLDYIKGTPLEDLGSIFTRGTLVAHVSKALPFVTLYKYSGIYLGLDTVVVKPLKILEWNFVTIEPGKQFVGSSVMAFSRNLIGRQVAEDCIRVFLKTFTEEAWDVIAPEIITEIMKKRCQTSKLTAMNVIQCHGVQVYDSKYLCPVGYDYAHTYFQPGSIADDSVFVHDTWDEVTSSLGIDRDSPYAKLASNYCPEIYTRYYHDFSNLSID